MYKKTYEMKIIRTQHEVTLYTNTRVMDLIKDLGRIPDEARLIETRDGNEGDTVDVILVFRDDAKEAI